ncbi:hypothetical protein BHM03_00007950 [Ensete ventricosum]|nr:hypothetical protein BHM03_00007950 [Ensete ventricosum]
MVVIGKNDMMVDLVNDPNIDDKEEEEVEQRGNCVIDDFEERGSKGNDISATTFYLLWCYSISTLALEEEEAGETFGLPTARRKRRQVKQSGVALKEKDEVGEASALASHRFASYSSFDATLHLHQHWRRKRREVSVTSLYLFLLQCRSSSTSVPE